MNDGHYGLVLTVKMHLKMWDISDKMFKTVILGKSFNTTCKSLDTDCFTIEEEKLQLIVPVLELEFNGESGLQNKTTSACM